MPILITTTLTVQNKDKEDVPADVTPRDIIQQETPTEDCDYIDEQIKMKEAFHCSDDGNANFNEEEDHELVFSSNRMFNNHRSSGNSDGDDAVLKEIIDAEAAAEDEKKTNSSYSHNSSNKEEGNKRESRTSKDYSVKEGDVLFYSTTAAGNNGMNGDVEERYDVKVKSTFPSVANDVDDEALLEEMPDAKAPGCRVNLKTTLMR